MEVFDQLKRRLILQETPKRIISLVPSLTELLCDIGLRDSIVGVTKFCVHPSDLRKEKTVIGGTKKVNKNIIKSLKPDIIIANKEENTQEIIAALEALGPIHTSDISNLDDCFRLIEMYGQIFQKQTESKILNDKLRQKLDQFKRYVQNKKKKKVAYFIWKEPWMVAASDTFIDYILSLNKFENYFANRSRYPEIDLNEIESENLDYIFLSSEPFPFKEKHIDELRIRNPNSKIELVDGEMFSWYGSRLLRSFDYFKKLNNEIR